MSHAEDERIRLLSKIRRLLDRDEGKGATEAEAATALAMARRLMEQHRIDMAELSAATAEGPDWVTEAAGVYEGFSLRTEADFIGPLLGEFFNVRPFVDLRWEGRPLVTVRIFGDRLDVEVATWVYRFLSGTFADLWVEHRCRTRARKDRRRAFYAGLAAGLGGRLSRERGPREPAPASNELALRDVLRVAFEQSHPDMPTGRQSTFRDGRTLKAGMDRGWEINIARPVGKPSPRGLEFKGDVAT